MTTEWKQATQARYTTAILKVPSGKGFIVVGSVPVTCCHPDGRQRLYGTEQECLTAILADPWIQQDQEQGIQLSDCSFYKRG